MRPRVLFFSLLLVFQGLTAQDCFYTSASNVESIPGTEVCVKVNVHNYEDISAIQYTINWDSNVLEFSSTSDYSLPGLSSTNFGLALIDQGVLTFSWADPSFEGSNLMDRTHIYTLCFDVIGDLNTSSPLEFTSSHTSIEVVDGNQQTLDFHPIPGEVAVVAIVDPGEKIKMAACVIDPSCSGNEDGSLRLVVEGGENPLDVNWEGPDGFSSTSLDFISNVPGLYSVTVIDDAGIIAIDSFELKDVVPKIKQQVVKDIRCHGQLNGSINIVVEDGTPPYTFEWNNNSSSQNQFNLGAGIFSVTFTDSLGCSGEGVFSISEPDSIVVGEVQTTCPSLNMADGVASLEVEGGVLPYNFFWSDGNITNTGILGNFPAGSHGVTISDGNNCPFIDRSFTMQTGIDSVQANYTACGGNDVPLVIFKTDVTSYEWSPADLVDCIDCPITNANVPNDTTIHLTVTTETGCQQSAQLSITTVDDCVWPGDMNDDGVVNYLDLLWAGLANQTTGPIRQFATTMYIGQGADDWNQETVVSNINYKYIDANGDGTIDDLDVQVIEDNYALEHNFLPPDPYGQSRDDIPPFYIAISDTVEDNTLMSFDLILGSADKAIASAHGLAFQIQFEESKVNVNDLAISFDGWLGSDLWTIDRLNMTSGLLDVGVTRNDLLGQSGAGKIGTLSVSFNTVTAPTSSSFEILNAYLINDDEGPIEIKTEVSDFIIVSELISGLEKINPSTYNEKVSPNPVSNAIYITSDRIIESFNLYSLKGKKVRNGSFASGPISLDNTISSGIYYLELLGPLGLTRHKLVKL